MSPYSAYKDHWFNALHLKKPSWEKTIQTEERKRKVEALIRTKPTYTYWNQIRKAATHEYTTVILLLLFDPKLL